MSTPLCTLVLLAPSYMGLFGHHVPKSACCDTCGVEKVAVLAEIQTLQTCPRWRTRDNAAHALRKFDWRCHPEAAQALVTALLTDCEEEVREEAAQSLTKMAPCLPEVHAALRHSADCDPDSCTRKWARKALKALGNRCVGDCTVCGPPPATVIETPPAGEPALIVPGMPEPLGSPPDSPPLPAPVPEPSDPPLPLEPSLSPPLSPPAEAPPVRNASPFGPSTARASSKPAVTQAPPPPLRQRLNPIRLLLGRRGRPEAPPRPAADPPASNRLSTKEETASARNRERGL